jgi:hypothetical protein
MAERVALRVGCAGGHAGRGSARHHAVATPVDLLVQPVPDLASGTASSSGSDGTGGFRVTALHVIHTPLQPPMLAAGLSTGGAAVAERRALEKELRVWLEAAHRPGVKTDVVDEGNAAARVLEHSASR